MQPVNPDHRAIILASGSPRRRQLVQRIGMEPIVRVSSIPEEPGEGEGPAAYARRLAREKALSVAEAVADQGDLPDWILAADTVVVHEQKILEKPVDAADARAMLGVLAGNEHEVITAFCWCWRAPGGSPEERKVVVRDVSARVWMRDLSDEMIARYVATEEPMDKAGSYGIQDIGSVLVRRIEGSYFCVVGLPVCEVVEELEGMGGLESYPF